MSEVTAGGAASRAGLRAGDVVVRVGSRALEDSSDLRHALGFYGPGEAVDLEVYRDGALRRLRATLGEATERSAELSGSLS